MAGLGYTDVEVTPPGSDEGLDVVSREAVAQVKHRRSAVGRPDVQRLLGASGGRHCVFFALTGYTREAIKYADGSGISLLTYSSDGDVMAANEVAELLLVRELRPLSDRQKSFIARYNEAVREIDRLVRDVRRLRGYAFPKRHEKRALTQLQPLLNSIIKCNEEIDRLAAKSSRTRVGEAWQLSKAETQLDALERHLKKGRRLVGR